MTRTRIRVDSSPSVRFPTWNLMTGIYLEIGPWKFSTIFGPTRQTVKARSMPNTLKARSMPHTLGFQPPSRSPRVAAPLRGVGGSSSHPTKAPPPTAQPTPHTVAAASNQQCSAWMGPKQSDGLVRIQSRISTGQFPNKFQSSGSKSENEPKERHHLGLSSLSVAILDLATSFRS